MPRTRRPSARRRGPARVAAAAVLAALTVAGGSAAPAQAATTTRLAVQPATTAATGSAFTVRGTLTPRARRTVQLQLRSARRWTTIATGTSSRTTGRFALTTTKLTTAGSAVLRVRAPRTRTARLGTSRAFTVTVQGPGAGSSPGSTTPGATPTPTPKPGVTPTPGPVPTPGSSARAFRVLSIVASDQPQDLGKAAAIRATIDAVDGWYATQTIGGVRPRWVREGGGQVVVTTVTLPGTAASYTSKTFTELRTAIAAASPQPSGQKTLAFFDINATGACGVTGSDLSLIAEATCDIHPISPTTWPYNASYLVAHELTHNFGAVPSCAPHAGNGGHVIDDPRDLLYAGASPRDWSNQTLDPGRDDYYATGNASCPGIEASPFWTATADPLS